VKSPARLSTFTIVVFIQAALWILLDQLSKWWAESTLEFGRYEPLIGDVFGLRLVYNPGAAFGLASGYTWILTIVAAVAVVGLLWFSFRIHGWWWTVGVGALLGGAISHLGDRLFRDPGFAIGHIVDFLDYAGFFVGNVADIALVGGAALLILASLLSPGEKDEVTEDGGRPAPSSP
jgi:signal peptidase II